MDRVPISENLTSPWIPAVTGPAISVIAYRHARRVDTGRWGASVYGLCMGTVAGALAFAWWDLYAPTHPVTHRIAHHLGMRDTRMVRYAGESHPGEIWDGFYYLGCGEVEGFPGESAPPARPLARALSLFDAHRLFSHSAWLARPGFHNRTDTRGFREWSVHERAAVQARLVREGFPGSLHECPNPHTASRIPYATGTPSI